MTDTSPENLARGYLICKHGLYYAPNSQGYTGIRDLAGRYTLEEARRSSHPNGSDGTRDGMDYLHESEAPEFSPKCFDDLKVKHLLKQRDALAARLAEYDDRLTDVMPLDFKDWHENSKAEWPQIAAQVLKSLRERAEDAEALAARLAEVEAERDKFAVTVVNLSEQRKIATLRACAKEEMEKREAAEARAAKLTALLDRAKEELRLIRMKDTGAVYDVMLRIEIDTALQGEKP